MIKDKFRTAQTITWRNIEDAYVKLVKYQRDRIEAFKKKDSSRYKKPTARPQVLTTA